MLANWKSMTSFHCLQGVCSLGLLFVVGCTGAFTPKKDEARAFVDESLPMGTTRTEAISFLRAHDFQFRLFQREQCRGFVIEPHFRCMGGSAIYVTLEDDVRSWLDPFHNPSLHCFLAFDADERLADSIVSLDSWD